jgi:hypothetical protein
MVSFTPRSLYHRGKSPRYTLDRRLGGHQIWSGWHGEVKILSPHRDSNSDPLVVHPVASCYTDCAIPAHLYYIVDCIIYTLHNILLIYYDNYFHILRLIKIRPSFLVKFRINWQNYEIIRSQLVKIKRYICVNYSPYLQLNKLHLPE